MFYPLQFASAFVLFLCFSVTALSQAAASPRVDFVYFGGPDCPFCVGWEAYDLPKLKASALFQKVRFTKVTKSIRSPVPSSFWFPEEIKHLHDPIADRLKGVGSPMFAILADDNVVATWKGTWKGPDEILRIFEKQLGEPSSVKAPGETVNPEAAR